MTIPFVLMIGVIGVSISLALYSSFIPYFGLLGDIEQYNKAYYGAQTALERSLLVLKYHEPGFEGESGRKSGSNVGLVSDSLSGNGNIGYLNEISDLFWTIESRMKEGKLPLDGESQIPLEFLSNSGPERGVLSYRQNLRIPLWIDNSPIDSAYTPGNISNILNYEGQGPNVWFTLNEKIYDIFGSLKESDVDGDGFPNDIAVNWMRNGKYDAGSKGFSILPRSLVGFQESNPNQPIVTSYDESIRMGDINAMTTTTGAPRYIKFGAAINPLYGFPFGMRNNTYTGGHLMIGGEDVLLTGSFNSFVSASSVTTQNELEFSLQNLLVSQNADGIYPFLQWRIEADSGSVAKPFFTLIGTSQVGEYHVSLQIQQPIDGDYLGSFTVVF